MEKLSKILIFCSLIHALAIAMAHDINGISQGPEAVREWFKNLPNAKEKVTELHFYFHDTVSGKNPTAITVAQSNSTRASSTGFGLVNMMDDPLTIGPEPNSKIIGRAQGVYASGSLEEVALLMNLNFVFTDGEYKNSTLSVLARNPVFHQYREMPIVGGSGIFRLARGIATAHTVWFNAATGDAVVEYNLVVLHY